MHIWTDSAYVLQVWQSHGKPLSDGDNHDVIFAIHSVLSSRGADVFVSKVEGDSGSLLNDAADASPKAGARKHHTVEYLAARKSCWQHRDCVVTRRRLMLEIILERARVAKVRKLLTYAVPSDVRSSAPLLQLPPAVISCTASLLRQFT